MLFFSLPICRQKVIKSDTCNSPTCSQVISRIDSAAMQNETQNEKVDQQMFVTDTSSISFGVDASISPISPHAAAMTTSPKAAAAIGGEDKRNRPKLPIQRLDGLPVPALTAGNTAGPVRHKLSPRATDSEPYGEASRTGTRSCTPVQLGTPENPTHMRKPITGCPVKIPKT